LKTTVGESPPGVRIPPHPLLPITKIFEAVGEAFVIQCSREPDHASNDVADRTLARNDNPCVMPIVSDPCGMQSYEIGNIERQKNAALTGAQSNWDSSE
jgi:hypothetical protein